MMKTSDLIAAASCFLLGMLSLADGKHHNKSEVPRVIGGRLTDVRHYPYMVSVQKRGSYWYHHCGGSIVASYVVLTACHCLVSQYTPKTILRHPNELRIVAGVSDLRYANRGQQILVKQIKVHPRCGGGLIYADAGVIILQRPVRWSSVVQPIKFKYTNRKNAKAGLWHMQAAHKRCSSPGWGTTSSPGYTPSTALKVTTANLMTSKECSSFFCSYTGRNCHTDFYNYHQVCASSPEGIVCNGDSGGPLICDGNVVGVVSWKWRCISGWPHVYSDIGPILDVVSPYIIKNSKP